MASSHRLYQNLRAESRNRSGISFASLVTSTTCRSEPKDLARRAWLEADRPQGLIFLSPEQQPRPGMRSALGAAKSMRRYEPTWGQDKGSIATTSRKAHSSGSYDFGGVPDSCHPIPGEVSCKDECVRRRSTARAEPLHKPFPSSSPERMPDHWFFQVSCQCRLRRKDLGEPQPTWMFPLAYP